MGVAVGREAPIQRGTLFFNEANRLIDTGGGPLLGAILHAGKRFLVGAITETQATAKSRNVISLRFRDCEASR